MARKQHIVQRVGVRPWPQAVVCVQAAVRQTYLSESDDVGTLLLNKWAMTVGPLTGSDDCERDVRGGISASSWWKHLREYTHGFKRVLIVSQSAREVAAALGLWDQLAAGTYTLHGADPWYVESGTDSNDIRRNGYIVLQGPPTVICFRSASSDTVYTWIDPANFGCSDLRMILAEIQKDGPDLAPWKGEPWQDDSTLDSQCIATDVFVTGLVHVCKELDLGGLDHTAASLAHNGFKYRYMSHDVTIHDSEQVLGMERQALVGGRCEARHIGIVSQHGINYDLYGTDLNRSACREGTGPIYHLDVNSLYPAMAFNGYLPVKLQAYCKHVDIEVAIEACKRAAVIARVDIETDVPCVPYSHAGITVWPVGSFRTVLCGPEILLAEKEGCVKRVVELACYEARPLYAKWVDAMYAARVEMRRANQPCGEQLIKALMNSSFGKWAQLSRQWQDDESFLPISPYCQWYGDRLPNGQREQLRALAWRTQRLVTRGETNESFPAITAYINSMGRVRLWELLMSAGLDNVYYYDTDSIWCNQAGRERLYELGEMSSTDLGKLKQKGVHSTLRLMGRQCYEADGVLTLSGYNRKTYRSGDSFASSLHVPPVGYYLLKGKSPGLERHTSRLRTTRPYLHGTVRDNGTVDPIRVDWDKIGSK